MRCGLEKSRVCLNKLVAMVTKESLGDQRYAFGTPQMYIKSQVSTSCSEVFQYSGKNILESPHSPLPPYYVK